MCDEVLSDVHIFNRFDLLPDKSSAITRFQFYLPVSKETLNECDLVEPSRKKSKVCCAEEENNTSEASELSTSTTKTSTICVDKDGDLVLERNATEQLKTSFDSESSKDACENDPLKTHKGFGKGTQKRKQIHLEPNVINIKHSLATELTQVGQQVWLGALLLCDYIIYKSSELRKKTVVDLGSGTGLTSIVAALFAEVVYCTDVGENVLDIAKYNVGNQICLREHSPCPIVVKEVDWCKPICKSESRPYGLTEEDVSRLCSAEMIIAADVVYDNDITDAFINTVMSLISLRPNKTLLIGLEKRLVFTIEDLDIASPAYDYFRKKLHDLSAGTDKEKFNVRVEQVTTDFPQYFWYKRTKQLELWLIETVFEDT